MDGWHHQLNGHECEQTPGDGEGQGSLACCIHGSQSVGRNLAIQQQHSVLWGCPGDCRMFISIPGPYPLDASGTTPNCDNPECL